jgi:hypothetical protein
MPTGEDVRKLAAALVARGMAHSPNQAERLIGSAVQALAIHHGNAAGKRFLSGNFTDEDTAPTGMEMEDDHEIGAPIGAAPVVKQSQTRKDAPGALGTASPKARNAAAAAANPTGPSGTQLGASGGIDATGGTGMHKKKGLTIHIVRGPRGGFYEVTQNHGYRRISQEEYEQRMGAVQGQSAGDGDDIEQHEAEAAPAHGLPRFHSSNVEGGRSAMHPADAADEAMGEEEAFAHRHGGAITTPTHHHAGKTNLTVQDVAAHIAHLAEFDAGDGRKGHRLTWISQPIRRNGRAMSSGSHSIDFSIHQERDGAVSVQPLLLTYLGKHRLTAKQIAFLIATGRIHPKDADPDHIDPFGDPTLLSPDELRRGDMGQINQVMAHLVSYAEHMRGTAVNAALAAQMGENDHWRKEQQFAHFAPPPRVTLAKSARQKDGGYFPHPRAARVQLRPLSAEEVRAHIARLKTDGRYQKSFTQPKLFNDAAYDPKTPEGLATVMNGRDWYHGSGTAGLTPAHLDPAKTSPYNVYGSGVYLTGDPRIARRYAAMAHGPREEDDEQEPSGRRTDGLSGAPTVYHARTNFRRLLNLNDPAPAHLRDAWRDALPDDDFEDEGGAEAKRLYDDPATTADDLYSHLGAIDDDSETPYLKDELNGHLQRRGYDGLYTYGDNGWQTGHAHMAVAFHDPHERITRFAPHGRDGAVNKSASPMVAVITRATHPLHPRLPGAPEPHVTAGIRVPKGHRATRVMRARTAPAPRAPRLTSTPTPYGSVNGGDPSWEVDMAAYDGTPRTCAPVVAQLLTQGHVGIDNVQQFVAAHRWRYALIPSARIRIDPANRDLDPEKIAAIRDQIQAGKRLPPLIAVDSVNGGYDLKDGHHRYTGEVMEGCDQHRLFVGSPRKT